MHEIVVNPYGRKDGGRRGLMLKGPWDASCAELMRREGLNTLFLNSSRGWVGHDCAFLRELPQLEELSILAPTVTALEALESLQRLQELEITCSTRSKVDFARLASLERAYVYWWPSAATLLHSSSLRRVHLDKAPALPAGWASGWAALQELALSNSVTSSLDELAGLPNLEKLELHNLPKVADFSPVGGLARLRWLSVRGCRQLRSIDFAATLRSLEVLLLDDNAEIASLAPLAALDRLQALSFTGTTRIADGDLSVLASMRQLSMLGFAPRRHYSHRLIKPWAWSNFGKPDRLLEPR